MLRKKMMNDFKAHIGQFFSIFFLSFLAICLYTGLAAEISSVNHARRELQQKTNLANHWIVGNDFSKEELEKIRSLEEIDEAQRRIYIETTDQNNACLFLYLEDENIISKPLVLEGEAYDTKKENAIWICGRFAKEQNLKVGDYYTVYLGGQSYCLQIAGLIWSPEYEYYKNEVDLEPDYTNTGYAFASERIVKGTKMNHYNQIVCKSSIEDISNIEDTISEVINGNYQVMLNRDGIINLTTVDNEIKQHKMMALLFPVFFVVIAMLTTITTMKRIMDRQRTQIGTLKAIGMKKKKIYIHYLSYGFIPSLSGTILGTVIGPFTLAPLLFRMKYYMESSDEYMLPHFSIFYTPSFILLGIIMVVVCTLATWLSCRKILRIEPATALRPAQPRSSKKTIFEKLPIWNRLGFHVRYNLRDIARNKARAIFGLAGTISCMALLLCGFSSKSNFEAAVADLYVEKLLNNSSIITLAKDADLGKCEELRDTYQGELVMSETVEIKKSEDNSKSSFHMNVYEDSRVAKALDEDLNMIDLELTDFTLTQKTAEQLGISVGDTIQWHIYGSSEWVKSTVTKITRAPFEQGIVTTRAVIEESGYLFTPTRLVTQMEVPNNLSEVYDFVDDVTTNKEITGKLSNYMGLINLCMGFMIIFALFLAVIVLYSMALLSYEERQKEMATMKVLGLKTKKLRQIMQEQNLLISLFGGVLGIPLGQVMICMLMNSLGDSMDIPTNFQLAYVLLSFIITVGVSVFVGYQFSGRIKTMDMVEEIKSAE